MDKELLLLFLGLFAGFAIIFSGVIYKYKRGIAPRLIILITLMNFPLIVAAFIFGRHGLNGLRLFLAMAILMPVLIVTYRHLFIRIVNPIKKISLISSQIASGDLRSRMTITSNDELGDMTVAFNEMIDYLNEMAGHSQAIAGGDLTREVRLHSDHDRLSLAVVEMVNNLNELIREFTRSTEELHSSSELLTLSSSQSGVAVNQIVEALQEISTAASKQVVSVGTASEDIKDFSERVQAIARGATEQAEAIQKSNSLSDQIDSAVQHVKEKVEAGVRLAGSTNQSAKDGRDLVEENMQAMLTIQDRVNFANSKVSEMNNRAGEIGGIIETIDEVAEQTNLLALNAAIEAARAGEHGKGFAVVADEVRKLAERTSKSTDEITDLVSAVQKAVGEASGAMSESIEVVEAGVHQTNRSQTGLENISSSLAGLSHQIQEINGQTDQIKASSRELVGAMEKVSLVLEENLYSTEVMAAQGNRLALVLDEVSGMSEQSSASVEEVNALTEEVAAQVEEVSASSKSLEEAARHLQTRINRFHLKDAAGETLAPDMNQVSDPAAGSLPILQSA